MLSTWSSCLPFGKLSSSASRSCTKAACLGKCTRPASNLAACTYNLVTLSCSSGNSVSRDTVLSVAVLARGKFPRTHPRSGSPWACGVQQAQTLADAGLGSRNDPGRGRGDDSGHLAAARSCIRNSHFGNPSFAATSQLCKILDLGVRSGTLSSKRSHSRLSIAPPTGIGHLLVLRTEIVCPVLTLKASKAFQATLCAGCNASPRHR